jgi:hypothetical protein
VLQRRLDQARVQAHRNEPGINHDVQEARLVDRRQVPLRESAGAAWNFNKISIFPPNQQPSLPPLRLQPKLATGAVNVPLEHEADRVAEQVMRMPDPDLSITAIPAQLSRKCTACEEEEKAKMLQSKPATPTGAAADAAPPIVHEVLRSPGQPLDAANRAFFEPRFGYDFSRVRIHTDTKAAESTTATNALAYTVGEHIAFAANRYEPGTSVGRKLLAHELAHVVQQNARTLARQMDTSGDTDADVSGTVLGAGGSAAVISASRFSPGDAPTTSMAVTPSFIPGKWFVGLTTDTPGFTLESAVDVTCNRGTAAGYEVGIVQVETREFSEATYFGDTPADGSLTASKSQIRKPSGSCIDSRGAFWTADGSGEKSVKSPTCGKNIPLPSFNDQPKDLYPGWIENGITHKPNYIRTIKMDLEFVDGLAVRTPAGSVNVLKWLRWGVNWAGRFNSNASGSTQEGTSVGGGFWVFGDDGVRPSEIPTVYAAPTKTCLEIANEATLSEFVVQTNANY